MTNEKTGAIAKVKEDVKLISWQSEYEEMRQSGMTAKERCKSRGISQSGWILRKNGPADGRTGALFILSLQYTFQTECPSSRKRSVCQGSR
jgi:hypothetical protein